VQISEMRSCKYKNKKDKHMKRYISTKIVNAKPMSWGEYGDFRKFDTPFLEERGSSAEGYLIEHMDAIEPDPRYQNSWIPKEEFEKDYKIAYTYLDRLHIERAELSIKINALVDFINSKNDLVDEYHKEQLGAMIEYCRILDFRISK
jgi:hypothetical protein